MMSFLFTALGGLGLFLLGMSLLTEGLRSLAGRSLRHMISRYTRTPLSGAATGAVATAIVQSSSATTVTAIGFVGAGVITFTQALGIIFGANIGTTITGWVVALLGFKLDIGLLAWPVVLVGALLRTLARGRLQQLGLSLAGLSLLLVGIDIMQQGMAHFEGVVTPDVLPDDSLLGRFQLLLIGVVITLVTQSSSAGIATAMVALGAGSISFAQAAAMVIGMNVGTTVTAAIATVGGSTAVRQTGFAHVIYNMMTGVLAFMLVGPYAALVSSYVASGADGAAQIAVVGFHTFFNTLGVILVLPFTGFFARFITRSVPVAESSLTRRLDVALLSDTSTALVAVFQTFVDLRTIAYKQLSKALLPHGRTINSGSLSEVDRAIEDTLAYLDQIKPSAELQGTPTMISSMIHGLDHLSRLNDRLRQLDRIEGLDNDHKLRRLRHLLITSLPTKVTTAEKSVQFYDRLRQMMRSQREQVRKRAIHQSIVKEEDWRETMSKLDSVRWLHRVSYHIWRIEHHLVSIEPAEKETDRL